jgi:hypothetical protein
MGIGEICFNTQERFNKLLNKTLFYIDSRCFFEKKLSNIESLLIIKGVNRVHFKLSHVWRICKSPARTALY